MTIDDIDTGRPRRYTAGDPLITMAAAHGAFRRDLHQMTLAVTVVNLRDPMRHEAIMNGWAVFKNQLRNHHRHEDRFIWPRLRERTSGHTSAQSMLDDMESEHALIEPLLARVDAVFAHPEAGELGTATEELS